MNLYHGRPRLQQAKEILSINIKNWRESWKEKKNIGKGIGLESMET